MEILVWILMVSVACGVDSLPQRIKIKITEENDPSAKSEGVSHDAQEDSLEIDSINEGDKPVYKNPLDLGSLLSNFNFYGDGASKTFNDATRIVETLSRLAIDQVKTIGTVALQSTDFINQSGRSLIPENNGEDDDFLYDKSEKVLGVYGKKSINEPTPKKSGNLFESILGSGLRLFTDSLNLNRALPQQTYGKSQQTYDSDEVISSDNRNNDNNEINIGNNRNNDNNGIKIKNNRNNENNGIKIKNNRNNDNVEINTRNNNNKDNNEVNSRNNRNNDNNENHSRNNRNNNNNERNRESSGRSYSDNGNESRGRSITSSSSISSVRSSRSRKKSTYDEDSDFLSDI